jgi:hypothetical protein
MICGARRLHGARLRMLSIDPCALPSSSASPPTRHNHAIKPLALSQPWSPLSLQLGLAARPYSSSDLVVQATKSSGTALSSLWCLLGSPCFKISSLLRASLRACRVLSVVPQHSCLPWLALVLTRLLAVTAAHSLFVHRASRVLVFVVELLNPFSLPRDFVIARALTGFVSSPARSRHDLVIVPCVIKKSQESGEDEASSVKFVWHLPNARQIAWIGKSLPISRIRVSC